MSRAGRQPPFISTLDMPVCSRSVRHAIRAEYRQLGVDHAPVLPSASPFLRNIHHGKIREDDESFKNAVDYMFDGLAKRNPQHFAVRQYAKYMSGVPKNSHPNG